MEKKIIINKMKFAFYLLFIVSFFPSIHSEIFAQKNELRKNSKLEYSLKLTFNKEAIERESYLRFRAFYDPEALDLSFSQGKFSRNELKIDASKFQSVDRSGNEGLVLTVSPTKKMKSGSYKVELKLIEKSPDLEIENGSLDFTLDNISVIPPVPVSFVKKAVIILSLLIFITIIFLIIINFKKRFPSGIIQIIEGTYSTEIMLKGKSEFSLKDELSDFPLDLILGKKIFGYYQGPSVKKLDSDLDVVKSTGEAIGVGSVISSDETLIVNFSGRTININYSN